MKCLFINNEGAGFADHIDVADGATVSTLFAKHLPGRSAADFLIRVNRQPAAADQLLVDGDRISITATKIAGAVAGVACGVGA
jgi:hypothetical protein